MIKLNINEMELPVFDVIQATPFHIPLKKKYNLYFEVPSVNMYFKFEAKYLKLIHNYFVLFSKVMFLELKEFKSMSLKKEFSKKFIPLMQHKKFKKEFGKIIIEYFKADFKLKKIFDIADPFHFSYIFLFIHSIVENVKKNFSQVAERLGVEMSETFSIFSKATSTKIEPRY